MSIPVRLRNDRIGGIGGSPKKCAPSFSTEFGADEGSLTSFFVHDVDIHFVRLLD